jgi:hypothetical protein
MHNSRGVTVPRVSASLLERLTQIQPFLSLHLQVHSGNAYHVTITIRAAELLPATRREACFAQDRRNLQLTDFAFCFSIDHRKPPLCVDKFIYQHFRDRANPFLQRFS